MSAQIKVVPVVRAPSAAQIRAMASSSGALSESETEWAFTEAGLQAFAGAIAAPILELITLVERQAAESKTDRNVIAAMADDLGAIHDELGLDPDDAAGAPPIIEAIKALSAGRAPAVVEQADALSDVTPFLYYRAESDGSIRWEDDCVCVDPVYDNGDYSNEECHSGKAYSEAQVRAIIAATRPVAPVQAAPEGWQLVPAEPTPEIIAAAAIAAWPTASPTDIALARKAAPIVLMGMDLAPGTTVEVVAAMLATMAPAYRAMLAAAPRSAA